MRVICLGSRARYLGGGRGEKKGRRGRRKKEKEEDKGEREKRKGKKKKMSRESDHAPRLGKLVDSEVPSTEGRDY